MLHVFRRHMRNIRPVLHGLDGLLNEFGRALRRLRGLVRQIPHLIRHHGKAFSRSTGTRRFHRRIERQNIGLKRNIFNGFDDFPDLVRGNIDAVHRLNHFLHLMVALFYLLICAVRLLPCFGGAFRILVDVTGNLVNGCGQLLHRAGLLRGTVAERLRTARHLFATGRHVVRYRIDLPQRFIEVMDGLIGISRQFAVAASIDAVVLAVLGEITLGNGCKPLIEVINDERQLLNGQSDAVRQTPQLILGLIADNRSFKFALRHILHGDVNLFQGRHNRPGQKLAGHNGDQNRQHQNHQDQNHRCCLNLNGTLLRTADRLLHLLYQLRDQFIHLLKCRRILVPVDIIGAFLVRFVKGAGQRQNFVLILRRCLHPAGDLFDRVMVFRQQGIQLCQRRLQRFQIVLQRCPVLFKLSIGFDQHLIEQPLPYRYHVPAHRPHTVHCGNHLLPVLHIDRVQAVHANHGHNPHNDDHRQNRTKTRQELTSQLPVFHIYAPSLYQLI